MGGRAGPPPCTSFQYQFCPKRPSQGKLHHVTGPNLPLTNQQLGKTGIKEISFVQGMYTDLTAESRDEPSDYKQPYASTDGVFLVVGSSKNIVEAKVKEIEALFGDSITKLFTESGYPRPDPHRGREQ